ncbi:hypothetical protein CXR04_19625 [Streptomyces sp. CMB-StM0423]|nr:hypothetical protein CXR04_19625 [Streptomyces sp. CMB-StM0423]
MTPPSAARPAPAGGPAGFDRRLVPPMVLGSILDPINSSMLDGGAARPGLADDRRGRAEPPRQPHRPLPGPDRPRELVNSSPCFSPERGE